ncbi:MAG: hypothetical protein WAV55_07545, partial [Clostridiaceae bacterium]
PQTAPNHPQIAPNILKQLQTSSNSSKHPQTAPNILKQLQTSSKQFYTNANSPLGLTTIRSRGLFTLYRKLAEWIYEPMIIP